MYSGLQGDNGGFFLGTEVACGHHLVRSFWNYVEHIRTMGREHICLSCRSIFHQGELSEA